MSFGEKRFRSFAWRSHFKRQKQQQQQQERETEEKEEVLIIIYLVPEAINKTLVNNDENAVLHSMVI